MIDALYVQLPLKHANTRCNVHFSRSLSDMFFLCYSLYLLAGLQPNIHCNYEQQADIVLLILYVNKLQINSLLSCFFLTMDSWVIVHFRLVLCLPWPLTFHYLNHTDTLHWNWSASGLAPYCLPSLQSWPRTQRCRGPFLFIMVVRGGFPLLVLLLFASTSSFHSLTSSLLPVCAVDQWSSHG